jgi:uncharacterized membrane protein
MHALSMIRTVPNLTGVPVLAVLCNHLAHHSTGWQLRSWWLLCGTMLFNIFVASAAVMFILFVFLYFTVMRRLKMLSSKNSVGSKVIGRRYDTAQNKRNEFDCVSALLTYIFTGYLTPALQQQLRLQLQQFN